MSALYPFIAVAGVSSTQLPGQAAPPLFAGIKHTPLYLITVRNDTTPAMHFNLAVVRAYITIYY